MRLCVNSMLLVAAFHFHVTFHVSYCTILSTVAPYWYRIPGTRFIQRRWPPQLHHTGTGYQVQGSYSDGGYHSCTILVQDTRYKVHTATVVTTAAPYWYRKPGTRFIQRRWSLQLHHTGTGNQVQGSYSDGDHYSCTILVQETRYKVHTATVVTTAAQYWYRKPGTRFIQRRTLLVSACRRCHEARGLVGIRTRSLSTECHGFHGRSKYDVRTDAPEARIASIIRVERTSELGITLALTSNRSTLRRIIKVFTSQCASVASYC
jgi:hypothetical protein